MAKDVDASCNERQHDGGTAVPADRRSRGSVQASDDGLGVGLAAIAATGHRFAVVDEHLESVEHALDELALHRDLARALCRFEFVLHEARHDPQLRDPATDELADVDFRLGFHGFSE